MRVLLFIMLLIFAKRSYCQISYNQAVISTYESVFSKQPSFLQQNVKSMPSSSKFNGFAFFTAFRTETLFSNAKKDKIEIYSIDENGKHTKDEAREDTIPGAFALYRSTPNKITINLGSGFGYFLEHSILDGKETSVLTVETGYSNLKLKKEDGLTNKLRVPVKVTKLTLSHKGLKKGEDLFGEVEAESDPYFEVSGIDPNTFVHKRMILKYVFKVKV